MSSRRIVRVLAVAPRTREFGFALVEPPDRLVDWGLRTTRFDKEERTLAEVGVLLDRFNPDVLVLEDPDHPSCRRAPRVRSLLRLLRGFREFEPTVWEVPALDVRHAIPGRNKHLRAKAIAGRLPPLSDIVPPLRTVTMNEDPRFAIFDAAGMVLTILMTRPSRRMDE